MIPLVLLKKWYTCTYTIGNTCTYVRTRRVRTRNVMSQLSDWKRAHMYVRTYVRTRVRTFQWYHGTEYTCTYHGTY